MTITRRPSPFEPLSHLARVPIVECGEPLVDFLARCPALRLDRPRYEYPRAALLRAGVADRLCRAAARLPVGLHLSVIEGWRAPEHQRVQYAAAEARLRAEHPDWPKATLRGMLNRRSAPPDGPAPTPHTTGGAVDLWLCDADDRPLDLCAPYDPEDPRSFPFDAPRLTPEARRRRALLRAVLEAEGLTNYPSEYWHWSYGDQGWAYRGGRAAAVYGAIGAEGNAAGGVPLARSRGAGC
jgi:D-alanyl-D-alanine dipeptidase